VVGDTPTLSFLPNAQKEKTGLSIRKRHGDHILELNHHYINLPLPITLQGRWHQREDLRSIVFIGPNGVGKSTLLHRLASEQRTTLISARRKTDSERAFQETRQPGLINFSSSSSSEAFELCSKLIASQQDTLNRHINPSKPTVHDVPLFDEAVRQYLEAEIDKREEFDTLWATLFPSLKLVVRQKALRIYPSSYKEKLPIEGQTDSTYHVSHDEGREVKDISDGQKEGMG